ncbi:protein of unknown function DUF861, cupin_3 [Candidatus Koribacter versatilis Ellin345]|uniref:(S)-ureidoglycine aminohydrolase cupin domain-containing protein n=1 Tax=Koribacter versatilis (strain Ellin345) TaxID=204669 RepID=Q1IK16_KORVE|nr:cupin domain-containing protein [Candidatus Koribacter versatilis]ABF42784.1 protein of unknown function DUF861, cupin_3 [Candidatus Koribacter versatilis Ellin345]
MRVNLESSAPHISPAKEWLHATHEERLVLFKNNELEVGLRELRSGPFHSERDTVCYFQGGAGRFLSTDAEQIAIEPGTLVHFKEGWSGTLNCSEPMIASYMSCAGGRRDSTPVLRDAIHAAPLKDWGTIPTMIEGVSRTAGILLSREPNGRSESGIWTCTAGIWRCEVTSDEYCHFLDGSCTYTHDSGEQIEIEPDTLAYFPEGWKGRCEVRRTIRKVYMIR